MKKLLLILACAFTFSVSTVYAQDELVNNAVIIQLLLDGFSDEEIIGYIESSSNHAVKMDLHSMRELKQHNASTKLIKYLQNLAKTDFGYDGIYWWDTPDGKPQKLYRSSFEHETKNAGISSAVTTVAGGLIGNAIGGNTSSTVKGVAIGAAIGGGKVKSESLALLGAHAAVVLTTDQIRSATFRFYIPKTEAKDLKNKPDAWYYQWMNQVQSPNEFECLKLKEKKNKRTLPEGLTFSVAGFGSTTGGKKNVVDFIIKSINNTTFEVSFPNGLEPGEYCFFYKNHQNKSFANNICCFDFSVQ